MKKSALALFLLAALGFAAPAQDPYVSMLYSQKEDAELFVDWYPAASGAETGFADGTAKPAVIFVFGGGFKSGSRHWSGYGKWFGMLTEAGYQVFSIDYRLGLKNSTKAGVGQAREILGAVNMAVEDLFDATAFLIENADQFGIDPSNIVISGSSAGAMTVLQADWYLSNGNRLGSALPEGFRYAGVMSFSGAVISDHGMPSYKAGPSPTLLLHGTDDKVVNYGKMHIFNWALAGSSKLAKIFSKKGRPYQIYRFTGHGHDIAESMAETFPRQQRFLEDAFTKHPMPLIDSTITNDPNVPVRAASKSRKELYSK